MQDYLEIAQAVDRFMRKLHIQMHARAGCADEVPVPPAGVIVLLTLADQQPMSMHDLATLISRDKSQVSRLVRDLECQGLLLRARHSEDARVSLLSLTDAGTDLLARKQRVITALIADLLKPLDDAERTTLAAILNKL